MGESTAVIFECLRGTPPRLWKVAAMVSIRPASEDYLTFPDWASFNWKVRWDDNLRVRDASGATYLDRNGQPSRIQNTDVLVWEGVANGRATLKSVMQDTSSFGPSSHAYFTDEKG